MSKLSQFFTEKAKNLYGEDESRKSQSLAQFREWIKKHPFITGFNPSKLSGDLLIDCVALRESYEINGSKKL